MILCNTALDTNKAKNNTVLEEFVRRHDAGQSLRAEVVRLEDDRDRMQDELTSITVLR